MALYIEESFDVEKLRLQNNQDACMFVRIRGKACRCDILLMVSYRPPNQDELMGEAFYEQLTEVARSPALILLGDFNLPDICWEYNKEQRKQSKRFLACMEDSFLTQLV